MDRINQIPLLLKELVDSDKYYFNELKPSQLEKELAVIYSITNYKTNVVLYVGKTTKLRRRLYTNHLMGSLANARLKKYLIDDLKLPHITNIEEAKQYIKDNCYFQYIAEPDTRRRGQLEGLFSYLLDVKYVDKEH